MSKARKTDMDAWLRGIGRRERLSDLVGDDQADENEDQAEAEPEPPDMNAWIRGVRKAR